jgi:hypothetical protein
MQSLTFLNEVMNRMLPIRPYLSCALIRESYEFSCHGILAFDSALSYREKSKVSNYRDSTRAVVSTYKIHTRLVYE